jgi:hypothetical protein
MPANISALSRPDRGAFDKGAPRALSLQEKTMIDLYCERCGPGLLAEPINAATNLVFLIAAWAAWILARRLKALSPGIQGLILLAVSVGIGSGLFHTFATGWARVLDVVPILLFQLLFLYLYTRRVMGTGAVLSAILLVLFLVAALVGREFPWILNGSLTYAPAFLLLVGLGLYHQAMHKPGRWLLLGLAGLFVLSFVFRSIDLALCPGVPIGTHFLWHLLNGGVFYLSMRVLILNQPGAIRSGPG